MLTLNDGRKELWQWDTGRKLTVDADCSQVHFSNKVFGRSIDVDVADGVAEIPDILLQTDKDFTAWAFVGIAENGYTKISKTFKVNRRNKPADYVFTPPEQTTLEEILEKIDYLESIQDPDAIKNAVEDYLEQNPVEAPVQSVNGKTGEVELTAEDVGAISRDELQEATNEALAQAKASGEFDGDDGKDGYTPVKGIDYFTDEDKTEIAEMAAELVEVPEVGGAVASVEPAEDDIPKVFYGGALPQTKDDTIMPFRYISKTQDISGYCETKAQGTSSMNYTKKNQTTKFYKDPACTEKMKVDFKGWGKESKFCFKANWIDISHARNVVSARLWGDVVKSRSNYAELPELLRTSPNQGAIDGFPVKVYANGVYQGRYTLNIPKDGWMANMDKDNEAHCILCGENYVSGCFRGTANIDESDWSDELHETVPASIKTRWNEVINFVMNSTDDEFLANLGNYFYVDSLIDYYLFALASCGLDSMGKNQIYMTYDGQKWIASMYDMDSTWGLYFTGGQIVSTDYARTQYEDFRVSGRKGNLLYIRLEQLFYEELQARWAELKNGALSIANIINRFERFTDIAPAELVKEDYASTTGGGKFTGIPSQSTNNIQQIRAFALARQAWTDAYVAALNGESGGDNEEPESPDIDDDIQYAEDGIYALTKGNALNADDGTQTAYDAGFISGYIVVPENSMVDIVGAFAWMTVCAYDENKQYLRTLLKKSGSVKTYHSKIDELDDVSFIRVSIEAQGANTATATVKFATEPNADQAHEMTNGLTLASTGETKSGNTTNYALEEYVEVIPNNTYRVFAPNVWIDIKGYNADKVFVKALNTATDVDTNVTFTAPSDVHYVRWACTGSNTDVKSYIVKYD